MKWKVIQKHKFKFRTRVQLKVLFEVSASVPKLFSCLNQEWPQSGRQSASKHSHTHLSKSSPPKCTNSSDHVLPGAILLRFVFPPYSHTPKSLSQTPTRFHPGTLSHTQVIWLERKNVNKRPRKAVRGANYSTRTGGFCISRNISIALI